MWRSKKFIIIAVLVAVALVGSVGGVVLAQTGGGDNSPQAQQQTLMDKVCAIYQQNTSVALDSAELQKAFDQARSEMRDEALDNYLKNLVDQGTITQEQADQYKAWLQARPDMSQYQQQLKDWQQTKPSISPELKQWQEARPNIPLPRGFGGHGGFGGWFGPPPSE
jgi:hypothetical protein